MVDLLGVVRWTFSGQEIPKARPKIPKPHPSRIIFRQNILRERGFVCDKALLTKHQFGSFAAFPDKAFFDNAFSDEAVFSTKYASNSSDHSVCSSVRQQMRSKPRRYTHSTPQTATFTLFFVRNCAPTHGNAHIRTLLSSDQHAYNKFR